MNNTFQIINTTCGFDFIEVLVFNTLTANTFNFYIKAEDFDIWAEANLNEELMADDLWYFYEQNPSLFKAHIKRFIFSEMDKGLVA